MAAVVGLVAVAAVAVPVIAGSGDSPRHDGAVRANPWDVYSPVAAGEELPAGFYQAVPRDFIEPIYEPQFQTASSVAWPEDADVIGVALGDEAKAYPISLLDTREMVVDVIDDIPILVTWCPVCGTAMAHRRELDGETLMFGTQGALWRNAMTWWDHDTGSIWSQPLGEAIAGPRTGRTLELLPAELTSWGAWKDGHPETLALDVPARATRFDLGDFRIVVDFDTEVRGYPVVYLREVGVVNDVVAGVEIAVVSDPADLDRWAVFSRRVGGTVVELEVDGEVLLDRVTGTTFDPVHGTGLSGPLADGGLLRLPALAAMPGGGPTKAPIFDAFWPEGTVWRPER